MQGPSGGGIGLRVLREEAAGDDFQCSKLLRVVLEFRGGDECGRVADVLLSDP